MPSEFFDLGNRSSNTTKENISSVSEFFDLPISESTVQADIAHALSLEGELGLEPGALSGNAPNSNLQPFDVKVPSGTTPEKMTKDIVTSKTIPSSGVPKPNPYNEAIRKYYEADQSIFALPLTALGSIGSTAIPAHYSKTGQKIGFSATGAEAPEPPGGWKDGKPLDENGKPYVVPSLTSDIHRVMVDVYKKVAIKTSAFADTLGVGLDSMSQELHQAVNKVVDNNPYWNEASKAVADMFAVPVMLPTSWALTSASKIIAKAITGDAKFADQIEEQVARQTTWNPKSELGQFVLNFAEPIFKLASEIVHRSIAHPLGQFPAVNPDPSKPLFSGVLEDYFPVEEIAQFGGEALLFKKAHEVGVGIKELLRQGGTAIKSGIEAKNIEKSLGYTPSMETPKIPYAGIDYRPFFEPPQTTGSVTTSGKVETEVTKQKDLNRLEPPELKKNPFLEMVEKTQAKIDEIKKVQAELALAKEAVKTINPEELIKEELRIKGEEVKEIKEGKESEITEELDPDLRAILEEGDVKPEVKIEGEAKPVKAEVTKKTPEHIIKSSIRPITDLGLQTGTPLPKGLSSSEHPFRDKDPKHTNTMSKLYIEKIKSADVDPEIFTRYLINEVNRYLNGEEPATPIEKIRDGLSNAAVNAENARSKFDRTKDFEAWKETITEAARWARESERPKEVKLTMGVDPTELIDFVKKFYHTTFDQLKPFQQRDVNNHFIFKEQLKNKVYSPLEKLENKLGQIEDKIDKANNADSPNDKLIMELEKKRDQIQEQLDKEEVDRLIVKRTGKTQAENVLSYDKAKTEKFREEYPLANLGTTEEALARGEYVAVWDPARPDIPMRFIRPKEIVKKGLRLIDNSKKDKSTLYMGIDPTQIPAQTKALAREIHEGGRRIADYTSRAIGMKSFKPREAAEALRTEFNRALIDRSGNIRRDLLNKLGDVGYRIIQKMYLSKGASSLAAHQLRQMRREVYDGLPRWKKKILDDIILDIRMLDIAKYKTKEKFKYPEEPADHARHLYSFKDKETNGVANLTEQEAFELYHVREDGSIGGRAGAYYDWMKKPLKDLLNAELISQKEYDALISHNYRKIKLIDIYDNVQVPKLRPQDRTVYDSGIEALKKGKDTDIYEPSSEVMALEVFNRSYGRILNNAANRTLLDLARTQRNNLFVRTKDSPSDMIPSGWHRIYVYEKGERKALFISPDMAREWITNSPEMSYKLSMNIRLFSGSAIVRTFATGINWGFALANLPRDVMHSWFAARTFQNGKWTPVFSSQSPVAAYQFGRNYRRVFSDTILRKGRYIDYINEGGGMEFLVHQGRLLQRGRHVGSDFDKFMDVMAYPGETSEIATRLNIREQVIINKAAEKGISFEEAYKDKSITQEATFAARDYMDFGQGGGIVKAFDNGLPYVNAGIQGMRGFWRALLQNPIPTLWKLSQFAAIITGLYIYNRKQNPETMKSLVGNINMQNNLVIPMGDSFSYLDEKGQIRYPYYKIPLDNTMRFFKVFFEAATDKCLGNPVDVDRVTGSLSQLSPVGISTLPPTISGPLGYWNNRNFWLNEDIWKGTDKAFDYQLPKWLTGKEKGGSEEEYNLFTPQAMKDFGAATGLSPERFKYLSEQLVTNGSEFAWLSGYGYDKIFGDLSKDQREQFLSEILAKAPIAKRFIGVTNPYSQFAGPIEKAVEESSIKRFVENRELDTLVDGYLYKGVIRDEGKIYEYIRKFDDKTQTRLFEDFEFQKNIKDLPNMSFWRGLRRIIDVEKRAELYVDRWKTANEAGREELRKELNTIYNAKGLASDEFLDAVARMKNKIK